MKIEKQTTYNKLRQILTDRLPHLRELSFGCKVEVFGIANDNPGCQYDIVTDNRVKNGWIQTGYYGNVPLGDFEIIGHPPTLQDVLLAISETEEGLSLGTFYKMFVTAPTYALTLPLSQQSDETLSEIIKLIE